MGAFTGSENKSDVRQLWDLPIIKRWSDRIEKRLSYFGLPGPHIEDLIDWQQYIQTPTGIEQLRNGKFRQEDLDVHRKLLKNVALADIVGFQLLRGDIESIILEGVDLDGARPQLSSAEHPLSALFRYELVNLDFLGGMGYKDKFGESRRVRALKKLLDRQRGTNFLFMLTLNVRDTIKDDITKYLTEATRDAANHKNSKYEKALAWYTNLGEEWKKYKLKALIPLFIKHEAERCGFECFCYPPLAYQGGGQAIMVHFVFELLHTTPVLHAFSQQSDIDIIDLPLIEAEGRNIYILPEQHPEFNFSQCLERLCYLPDDLMTMLLQSLPEK